MSAAAALFAECSNLVCGRVCVAQVGVRQVIQGWDLGILGTEGIPPMKEGGKRRLVIPAGATPPPCQGPLVLHEAHRDQHLCVCSCPAGTQWERTKASWTHHHGAEHPTPAVHRASTGAWIALPEALPLPLHPHMLSYRFFEMGSAPGCWVPGCTWL